MMDSGLHKQEVKTEFSLLFLCIFVIKNAKDTLHFRKNTFKKITEKIMFYLIFMVYFSSPILTHLEMTFSERHIKPIF